jgi:hypothetical protein
MAFTRYGFPPMEKYIFYNSQVAGSCMNHRENLPDEKHLFSKQEPDARDG